jgi:hypothetical protein
MAEERRQTVQATISFDVIEVAILLAFDHDKTISHVSHAIWANSIIAYIEDRDKGGSGDEIKLRMTYTHAY